MNKETSKYYTALQPFFQKKMRLWQEGDWLYNESIRVAHCLNIDDAEELNSTGGTGMPRLPLPIDPRDPERGLWGMLDWNHWTMCQGTKGDGCVTIGGGYRVFYGPPELALLKALAAQEKVEV